MEFRKLRADELEARVGSVKDNGCSVLIYKDARCDMNVLDETFGTFGWQRDHKELKGNIYCGIGIYDTDKGWIWKWDAGAETYTESVKGEASDSFKRAGFNWGIGRELYTCPFIWFSSNMVNIETYKGKNTTRDRFNVDAIEYEGSKVSYIKVLNEKTGAVFTWGKSKEGEPKITEREVNIIKTMIHELEGNEEKFKKYYKVNAIEDLTPEQYVDASKRLSKELEAKRGER